MRIAKQRIGGDRDHQEELPGKRIDDRSEGRQVPGDRDRAENASLFFQLVQQQEYPVQHARFPADLDQVPERNGLRLDGVEPELDAEGLPMILEQPQSQQPLHHQVQDIVHLVAVGLVSAAEMMERAPHVVAARRLNGRRVLRVLPELSGEPAEVAGSHLLEQSAGGSLERSLRIGKVTDHVMTFPLVQNIPDLGFEVIQEVRLAHPLGAFYDHYLGPSIAQKGDDAAFRLLVRLRLVVGVVGGLVGSGERVRQNAESRSQSLFGPLAVGLSKPIAQAHGMGPSMRRLALALPGMR